LKLKTLRLSHSPTIIWYYTHSSPTVKPTHSAYCVLPLVGEANVCIINNGLGLADILLAHTFSSSFCILLTLPTQQTIIIRKAINNANVCWVGNENTI